jgi:ribonuclease BN (tRNA processing enzyme)
VLVDCGEDWLGELAALRPQAIVLTHAHPDHAFGLRDGAPCPVWATAETWAKLEGFPVPDKRLLHPREPETVRGITFEAFPVQHSIRAPAVGYRITAGRAAVFYAPDLVYIYERQEALAGCRLYIGDGATVKESMVRKEGDQLFGHVPVRTQLTWCRKEGVPKMIVSHCGSGIVTGEDAGVLEEIRTFARQRGVEVEVAYDGMAVVVR